MLSPTGCQPDNLESESGRGCLEHLLGVCTRCYGLGSDVSRTTERALLVLTLTVGLQRRLYHFCGIRRPAVPNCAEGDAFDALTIVGGHQEIVQQHTHRR